MGAGLHVRGESGPNSSCARRCETNSSNCCSPLDCGSCQLTRVALHGNSKVKDQKWLAGSQCLRNASEGSTSISRLLADTLPEALPRPSHDGFESDDQQQQS